MTVLWGLECSVCLGVPRWPPARRLGKSFEGKFTFVLILAAPSSGGWGAMFVFGVLLALPPANGGQKQTDIKYLPY